MQVVTRAKSVIQALQSKIRAELLAPATRKRLAKQAPRPITSPFAVFFGDAPAGLYQLAQWLGPFAHLANSGTPVTLIVTHAESALKLSKLTDLPILFAPQTALIEDFVTTSDTEVVFYVNNNQANFTPLRMTKPFHVHLSHGESEKSSMVSNQLKAYDFAFIAGQASADRIATAIRRFPTNNLVLIGRPQLEDSVPLVGRDDKSATPIRVLYAPTWEGDSKSMAYGSVERFGKQVVNLLLKDPRFNVTYRPHPKTGSKSAAFATADKAVRDLILKNQTVNPDGESLIDEQSNPVALISAADLVITDVSAMCMDALGLDKPTLLLLPFDETTEVFNSLEMPKHVPTWAHIPSDAADFIAVLAGTPVSAKQQKFRDYVFGSRQLGSAMERFVSASHGLIGEQSQEMPATK